MTVYHLLHVPKTAGITIAEHLAAHCAPGTFWRPLMQSPAPPPADPARIRAVALGHYQGRALEAYFPGRAVRRAVLLRDPVGLQVSYYNWRMMYFLSQGGGTYSFDLHLATVPRNFMLHFLLHRWMGIAWPRLLVMSDARKMELAQAALSDFWFVGDSSDCDRLMAALAPELDVPPLAVARNGLTQWRDFVSWQPLRAEDLSLRQREVVRSDHALDQLLWETWRTAHFDARAVTPALSTHAPGGLRHIAARPWLEGVRLWRRTHAKRGNGAALRSALQAAPQSREAWRNYLTQCRARPGKPLPSELIGQPADMHDAILCLLKAEVLICCGQADVAAPFLRRAPLLAQTRAQSRDLTLRACLQDDEFLALVARADKARDERRWRAGVDLYRDALALYPDHGGYRVQYAHCLREQGDDVGAEIQYRSARALGAPWSDMAHELADIAAREGLPAPDAPPAPKPDAASLLDDPPTEDDVLCAWRIAGATPGGPAQVLALLRTMPDIRALLTACGAPERDFLADCPTAVAP